MNEIWTKIEARILLFFMDFLKFNILLHVIFKIHFDEF